MRTLKELAIADKQIRDEVDILWATKWKPRFDDCMTRPDFSRVTYELLVDAGVFFTDELPSPANVHLVIAMDGLRQRMKAQESPSTE